MQIQRFQPPDLAPPLGAQLDRLIEVSFPPAEREPFAHFLQAVEAGYYHLYLAVEGADLLGFAAINPLDCAGVFLLSYLAVDPGARSGGIGGRLLDHVHGDLKAKGGRGLLLEIESLAEATPDPADPRRRRLAFYRRHGAIPLDFPYSVPDLSDPTFQKQLRMDLLWLPAAPGTPMLSPAEIRGCVRSIYLDDYGLPPDHPLVAGLDLH